MYNDKQKKNTMTKMMTTTTKKKKKKKKKKKLTKLHHSVSYMLYKTIYLKDRVAQC